MHRFPEERLYRQINDCPNQGNGVRRAPGDVDDLRKRKVLERGNDIFGSRGIWLREGNAAECGAGAKSDDHLCLRQISRAMLSMGRSSIVPKYPSFVWP